MAQYNADILVNVKNQASLDRVAATLNRVHALAKEIRPINLFAPGNGAGADQINIAMRKIEQRAAAIAKQGSVQISATYAGAAQTADAFAEVLRNVNIEAKKGTVSIDEQSDRVKNLAFAYAEAEKKAQTLGNRYDTIIQQARQAKGLAIGPVSELGTVEADSAAAAARAEAAQTEAATKAQAVYQAQINKNLRTDVLYQRLKLNLILDQSDALLKQDSLTARLAKKAAQFGGAGKFGENLALGVGFPLLFGGGAGSVLGSAAGSFFGKGFGGQILGGALGQVLDQAVLKIRDIGNAIKTLNFDALTNSGVRFSSEVKNQLNLLLQVGDALTAQKLASQEVARETGTLPGVTEDVANSVNILNDSWRKVVNAVSTTLGILGAPFAAALAGILELVNAIFRVINTVFSLIGTGIKQVVEFVIQLIGGKEAVDFINNGIDKLNGGLSDATAQAAELRNTLNQSVVRSSIELQATRALTPGVTTEDKITNIRIQAQKELNLLVQDEIDARVQIRKENAKATAEVVDGLIRQNDLLFKNRRENISISAERQVTAEIQRSQAELDRKAAQELEKQRKELERIAKLRTEQLDKAQRSYVLAEASINIATANTKESEIEANYDKIRIERMYTYSDLLKNARSEEERNFIVATQYLEILASQIKQEKDILDTRKKQTEELYAQLDASNILNPQIQKQLGRGVAGEGLGIQGFAPDLNLDPNNKATKKLDEMKAKLAELADPVNAAARGAEGIGNAFNTAFQGIITGTQSTQEALSNFFKGVGDAFVSMATEIIAQMVVMFAFKQLLGLFGGGGGGLFSGEGPVSGSSVFGGGQAGFNPDAFGSGLKLYASGGFVTSPTSAVVGEGGEPEYIIPASKMRSAMNRYAAGARGSAVIPAGDGGDGGTATMAAAPGAIDVRYTVERINSVDYVTADQFQQGMQRAAQQGAAQGEQRTLRRLQMSTSTRKRLGM